MLTKKLPFILFVVSIFLFQGYNSVSASTSYKKLSEVEILKGVVKQGDTASSLLNKYLPLKTIYEINRLSSDIFSLTHIRKGQPYRIILKGEDLVGFVYEIDNEEKLVVQKENGIFSINQEPIKYDVDLEVVSATITSSLFEAVRKSGESSKLAQKLSDIFAWDIDFIRDIQPGDQFQILVEKRYRDAKFSGYGDIQAAFFTSNGTPYKAFLHKKSNGTSGYYDENGKSLQKAFLKAPMAFSRISSGFSPKRMHPILNEYRSHKGVDYAAPKGTPIKTVGDGVITEIGYNKSMGNYINIHHYNGYITSYYHMNKFVKGMKKKKKVRQGEMIGYVGMTGYATGNHLCFRMNKNGKMVDPLKYKSPPSNPIKPGEMDLFLAKIQKSSEIILSVHKLAATDKKEI
ncbi:MAG: peptidoglycan DD-metalloendopeptidase family protein [Desulfobacula sp.]|uniref:M23 family metallopeptidase n=1 Tax=Desulfobacula sp. TaxID=2593537 RepID=UPI001D76A3B2|nr:peptidoglycan DD-metalloendopeptidase family protein [Desulfobacula sp.]MBT6338649.1 peptidoglycan DD-metalloendopeptidase family protein [Desulfobacula sp.]MBT6751498.1 peptidoglycan DD-metalloendopeptidase family protein [Desulfobacula sp.]